MACWGANQERQSSPPSGTFTAVAAGYEHSCAIRTNGHVACWGEKDATQSTPSGGTASATCAIRTDSELACRERDAHGVDAPPSGSFTSLSSSGSSRSHACAIRWNGTVTCWESNYYGQSSPPSGTFTQVAVGPDRSCAIRTDGTVACWGPNRRTEPRCQAPTSSSRSAVISPAPSRRTTPWSTNAGGNGDQAELDGGACLRCPDTVCFGRREAQRGHATLRTNPGR